MGTHTETTTILELEDTLRGRRPGRSGELLATFARELYHRASPSYLSEYTLEQLVEATVSMFDWMEESAAERFHVRVVSAAWLRTASGQTRTAVQVTGPDQPFLVDTLRELVRQRLLTTAASFHPIVAVERDDGGRIASLQPAGGTGRLLSFMHLELDRRLSDVEARDLESEAREVFAEARRVADDFQPMVAGVRETMALVGEQMNSARDNKAREDLAEVTEFLEWLLRSNFVFLGACEYSVTTRSGRPEVSLVPGSGLGILRAASTSGSKRDLVQDLSPDPERLLKNRRYLTVGKTLSESRVLRRTRMDYVAIQRFDPEGNVLAERRFLGLYTSRGLSELPARVPILRRKFEQILTLARAVPGSHDHKEIFSTFCSLPRTQLFLQDVDTLKDLVLEIVDTRDRSDVRVHFLADPLERGVSVMVLIPRERFNPLIRQSIQRLLAEAFHGSLVEYHLALTDEPMARLHFQFETRAPFTPPPLGELETRVAALTKTWTERVNERLLEEHDVKEGTRFLLKYSLAFPAAYEARESPETASRDVDLCESALASQGVEVRIQGSGGDSTAEASLLKIARRGEPFHLSRLMPTLTHLGLEVFDETSYRVKPGKEAPVHLHSFRVLARGGQRLPDGPEARAIEETILAVLEGNVEDDPLNSLVVQTRVTWRQVDVLRTYTAYLEQIDGAVRQRTAYVTLRRHSAAAIALVRLFEARFAPDVDSGERGERERAARGALNKALEEVQGLQEDRILRSYENLISATVRTNYFQEAENGGHRPALALKLRCADIARMPQPRPLYETFVASPSMEGVHLRSGKVARGGIRWSSRTDDFRTEILGLMKAQRTKNALIVPVGAKGGFVLKRHPPSELPGEELRRQYEVFVAALLDVTDNVVDGRVVRPVRTVVHDDDDPYLVVAADRGTAAFSDLANEIARRRSFWLGDAFASGGSTGYNHKDEGITARGTWECVKRHFLAAGKDVQSQEFTAVGIGDMSGDVFGNGMLLARKVRLVAAFNHEHVFLDPSPDPELSYRERARLFRLPTSSWEDYDPGRISPGGGVYRRDAKKIVLSPEARELLGTGKDSVNGDDLVRAVLELPVELLFNGGIGTYVKASTETDLEVGDPANDNVRVNAADLRARVVGEGGNLGFTPAARVEFARKGGRINTDFVDNSGGVDLSDHEVNLKVLLEGAVKRDRISQEERNRLLREAAREVCDRVLLDNRLQSDSISLVSPEGDDHLAPLRFLARELEATGLLNRALEGIPTEGEFETLAASSQCLTRPQLAVLLAYAKIDAYSKVIDSELAGDPSVMPYLLDYFPSHFVRRFEEEILGHPLRREITVTAAVNECLNRLGPTFLFRLAREESQDFAPVLQAYVAYARLSRSDAFYAEADSLASSGRLPLPAVIDALRQHASVLEDLVRWSLRRGVLAGGGGGGGVQL
ncbi:MAG: NAD-glutamate dehydrogenase, partial [Planctomycetota bacterium]|nr:NAD-glutamate dehydrogenase [Planctomycetota bacterium]